jgi:hypothetical protein
MLKVKRVAVCSTDNSCTDTRCLQTTFEVIHFRDLYRISITFGHQSRAHEVKWKCVPQCGVGLTFSFGREGGCYMLYSSGMDVNSQVLVNLILLKWILKCRVGDMDLIHVVQGSDY